MLSTIALLSPFLFAITFAKDSTIEKYSYGTAVTLATVRKIQNTCIFPNDFQLLRRIAWYESRDGSMLTSSWDKNPGLGGIWQTDQAPISYLQNRSTTLVNQMKANVSLQLGVDISSLNRSSGDMQIPTPNAVIARAYLWAITPAAIPISLNAQAEFYVTWYNTAEGSATVQKFLDAMATIPSCTSRGIDLMFVLDSSGSIGAGVFNNVRNFVISVANRTALGANANRIGIINYSSQVNTEISFSSSLSAITSAAQTMTYLGSGTRTDLGLNEAVGAFQSNARDQSEGYPWVAVLVTDGQPDSVPLASAAADRLKNAGISLVAVGVTTGADATSLRDMASHPKCMFYYSLATYSDLATYFPDLLNAQTCQTSAAAPTNSSVISTSVPKDQTLYFRFPANRTAGITFKVSMSEGSAVIYTSTSIDTPSPGAYDYMVEANVGKMGQIYIPPGELLDSTNVSRTGRFAAVNRELSDYATQDDAQSPVTVFASITGTANANNTFELQFDDGDQRVSISHAQTVSARWLPIMIGAIFAIYQ